MPTKIGNFEILSELAKSPTCTVYKANDQENGQTIALKAIQLNAFGESATELEQALLAEADATKVLSSPNITNLFGAGEIEGQFCAAMEYVQGNSIATMLARKEGFSIWDLLDIGRQLCAGLDHAASHGAVHYSLEPSKIMCGWDGTVRILSFGVSSVGKFVKHGGEGVPAFVNYMSPEQISGQQTDGRSNLFSLGAMFYEMVTEHQAFEGEDFESLRQCIVESVPAAPVAVNPKVHPLLSQLIMKALAKDPAERYQNGRELLDDLEKCKEAKPVAAKKEAPKGVNAPKPNAAAQAKFVGQTVAKPKPAAPAPSVARPAATEAASAAKLEAKAKAAAVAAGAGGEGTTSGSNEVAELDLSNQFISSCVKATIDSAAPPTATMSSAVEEPQVETFEPAASDGPKIAVDPMMAEGGGNVSTGTSFSDVAELPPLKEVHIAPPPPTPSSVELAAAVTAKASESKGRARAAEKPRVQTREVAEKAIKEIKNVPPKLMLYSIAAAAVLILAIGIGVTYYIHSLNSDDDSGAARTTPVSDMPSQPPANAAQQQAPAPAPAATDQPQTSEPEASEPQAAAPTRSRGRKKSASQEAVVIPGQLAIDSTPQGAQVQIDGQSDPSWVTPFAVTNLQPGQHTIAVSKAGYSAETRSINVTSGNRASTIVHLAQQMATLIVRSTPAGASIFVDGRDVGPKTPAQVSVDKGQHVVLVRMQGYLDETMSNQFALGQSYNFAPTLRPLGDVDSIHEVGRMSRLFKGKGQAGQATISIHTQPKGAQVAINQHLMEKNSPLEVAVDPGNYVVDITLTGYAPVHKVINAQQGGKMAIDEVLQPQ